MVVEKKPQFVEKENAVAALQASFEQSGGVFLADYRGLTVKEVTDLRAECRKAGITYLVAKNTLIKIAANNLGIDALDEALNGPTAIVFAEDPVAAAKVISGFAKEHKNLNLKIGLLDKTPIDVDGINALAQLPSREVLLGKVLGGMQAPLYGLAGCCSNLLSGFVRVLNQVCEQKNA